MFGWDVSLRTRAHKYLIARSLRYPGQWTRYKLTSSFQSRVSSPSQRFKTRIHSQIHRAANGIITGTPYVIALFLCQHIVATYFYGFGPCDGISMLPTFNSFGDSVLISKYYRRGRDIQVGDVVSYKHPLIPEVDGLKRVVGLEGDFVLRDTPRTEFDKEHMEGQQKMIQIPQGHCWVVGDNLTWSRDSRTFGPLPMALIKGKAVKRFSPWWKPAPTWLEGLQDPDEYDDEVE